MMPGIRTTQFLNLGLQVWYFLTFFSNCTEVKQHGDAQTQQGEKNTDFLVVLIWGVWSWNTTLFNILVGLLRCVSLASWTESQATGRIFPARTFFDFFLHRRKWLWSTELFPWTQVDLLFFQIQHYVWALRNPLVKFSCQQCASALDKHLEATFCWQSNDICVKERRFHAKAVCTVPVWHEISELEISHEISEWFPFFPGLLCWKFQNSHEIWELLCDHKDS